MPVSFSTGFVPVVYFDWISFHLNERSDIAFMSLERQRSCCQQRNISASRRDPSAGWAQGRLRRRGEMSEFACRSRTMKIGLFHILEALAFGPLKRTLVTGRLVALPCCSLRMLPLSHRFSPKLSAHDADDAPHAANVQYALE